MVASLTYRTSDGTRWGGGLGTDLTATQVDLNFWTLFSALQTLQTTTGAAGAGIDFINQPANGNQFFIHLTNHAVLGPFIIPTAQWNPRGQWQPLTIYAAYDVVSQNGSLYLITIPHTSGTTFSPFSTDGLGHNLYNLLLQQPANELPTGGTAGQRLIKATGSPFATEWQSDFIRLAWYIEGQPTANEQFAQYCVADHMFLPLGLAGSVIFQGTQTNTTVVYAITKNGASIGSITFHGPSPDSITVSFSAQVAFAPGDVISITAPAAPDAVQSNISITLVATLTL